MPGVSHFVASERAGYKGSVEAMERIIAAVSPNIIHSNGLWLPYTHAAVVCARRHKIPLVIAPRGTLAPWAMNYKKWKKRLAWWLYQRQDLLAADAFHVTSEEEASHVRALGLKQPTILLPNGVDLPVLENTHARKRSQGEPRRVLYLGRIHFQKGLRELVQAWAEVKRSSQVQKGESSEMVERESARVQQKEDENVGLESRCPAAGTNEKMNVQTDELPLWQLELVGPDVAGHQVALIAEAERLGLKVAVGRGLSAFCRVADSADQLTSQPAKPLSAPDIIFTGPLDDDVKWEAYARADIVVLPSYTENFGLTVAEGLAAGKPVITTKGTPWSELLGSKAGIAEWQGNWDSGGSRDSEFDVKPGSQNENVAAQPDGAAIVTPATPAKLGIPAKPAIAANGRCGWWIEIGTAPLVAALKEATAMVDEQRAVMGANGRRLVDTRYGWSTISFEMGRAFEWILQRGEPPTCIRF